MKKLAALAAPVTSLRSHIADVLLESGPQTADAPPDSRTMADALLADPTLKAIIDLAASHEQMFALVPLLELSPEVRALLAAWRAER